MPIWYCKTCYTTQDPDDIGPNREELGLSKISENRVITPPCPYCSTPLIEVQDDTNVPPWDDPEGLLEAILESES